MAYSLASETTLIPAQAKSGRSERGAGNMEIEDHLQTYRGFLKGIMLFVAHIFAILLLLYYFLM